MIKEYIHANYDSVIGWGTGRYYTQCYGELRDKLGVDITYLIDNNPERWGNKFEGKEVYPPEILKKENPDKTLIIIFSMFYKEIKEQISKYGNFDVVEGEELFQIKESLENGERHILNEYEKRQDIIITISRNNYLHNLGGTSKFIREQKLVLDKHNYINLHIYWREYKIEGFNGLMLSVVKNGKSIGLYKLEDFFGEVKNIRAIIVHNLTYLDLEVFEEICKLVKHKTNILYYLHDFSSVCENIKLMYNDDCYCAAYEENWGICSTCKYRERRKEIFEFHKRLIINYDIKFIAPSESTKTIFCKSYNILSDRVRVIPHLTYKLIENNKIKKDKLRIAYVGSQSKFKGWEIFKKIFELFKDKYEFYCLGSGAEIIPGIKYCDVSFIKDGENAMVVELMKNSIDISFLWSICPETYSYTYYESFAAGSFVITNNLSGNIADQVRNNKNGIVLEDYSELIDLLSNEDYLSYLVENNKYRIDNIEKNNEFLVLI